MNGVEDMWKDNSSPVGVCVIAQVAIRRWNKYQLVMPHQPRSGGREVSPGRKPRVEWKLS